MNNYFSPLGTASRTEFWIVQVVAFAAVVTLYAIGLWFSDTYMSGPHYAYTVLITLAYMWVTVCAVLRRCREAGISPWWALVTIVPYLGGIATVVIGILKPGSAHVQNTKSES